VDESSSSPDAVSQSFVFAKRTEALAAFRSVRAASFGECIRDGLHDPARDRQEVVERRVIDLAFRMPLRDVRAGGLRAYRVALRLRSRNDGSEYTARFDVVVLLVSRTLSLHAFAFADDLTPDLTLFERTAVGRAAVRAFPRARSLGLQRELAETLSRARSEAAEQAAGGATIAKSVLLRRSDLPRGYRRSGSTGTLLDDCVDTRDTTVVGRASSPLVETKRDSQAVVWAASTSWVVATLAAAREVLHAVGRPEVRRCFSDTLRHGFKAEDTTVEPIVLGARVSAAPEELQAHTLDVRIKDAADDVNPHADPIALRSGRVVVLCEFLTIGLRTRALANAERAVVAAIAMRMRST
jgi:hypothetical protein